MFHELYAVLGDPVAQAKIWEHSDSRPCYILQKHPWACKELPEGFGGQTGKPCPNNPYERYADLFDDYRDAAELLEYARNLEDTAELCKVEAETLGPGEWTAIRILHRQSKQREWKYLASFFGEINEHDAEIHHRGGRFGGQTRNKRDR